jgi:hypothetical protein
VRALGLNAVRITDFLDVRGDPRTAPYAGRLLDLSTYRNLLAAKRRLTRAHARADRYGAAGVGPRHPPDVRSDGITPRRIGYGT